MRFRPRSAALEFVAIVRVSPKYRMIRGAQEPFPVRKNGSAIIKNGQDQGTGVSTGERAT